MTRKEKAIIEDIKQGLDEAFDKESMSYNEAKVMTAHAMINGLVKLAKKE